MPIAISLERYMLNRQYKVAVSSGDIALFHDVMIKLYQECNGRNTQAKNNN